VRLHPARRISLSQLVVDQLLEQIRDGTIKPGDRLPGEFELMRMLNVGRSSVREGLRALIALGLVETKPGRGAIVAAGSTNPLGRLGPEMRSIQQLQKSTLLNLLEVRESLEGQAAQLAAERATAMVAIDYHAVECEKLLSEGRSAVRANIDFHLAIAKATHNNLLVEALRHLSGQVREFRERMAREVPGISNQDLTEHRVILETIRNRDGMEARRLMIEHIRGFAARVRRVGESEISG
jgi:GntR family transcriptional regulator, transcriptional repressor for pyruvate dehydrogenase complex